MKRKKIFVMNVGSASTKVAYYEDESCITDKNIIHPLEEIQMFGDVMNQKDYRKKSVSDFMKENNLDVDDMDVVVSRGGHTKPLKSGAYRINNIMLDQIDSGSYGRHACDLGASIAFALCKNRKGIPMVVDTPVTDEFDPIAKLSGHPLFPRQCRFHALSHKATARLYSNDIGEKYEELNLISIHMGGGITLASHRKGLMVDGNNGIEGEGPYSTNRSGGLMAQYLINLCFDGKYTKTEISRMINGNGGLVAHLGESDVLTVQKMGETDPHAKLVLEGMLYQTCKEAGALAVVLYGNVDAILITGGIAHGEKLMEYMKNRLEWIAPVIVYPGENEMKSLALGALEALKFPDLLYEMEE